MGIDDIYKRTHGRPTDEIEHDDTTISTKRVQLWGWDGSGKVKIKVDANGNLVTDQLTVPLEQTPITTSSATTSAGISTGKNWMMIQNDDTAGVNTFFGSSAVTTANGVKCFPAQNYVFTGCASTFKVYFVNAVGDDGTMKVVER